MTTGNDCKITKRKCAQQRLVKQRIVTPKISRHTFYYFSSKTLFCINDTSFPNKRALIKNDSS